MSGRELHPGTSLDHLLTLREMTAREPVSPPAPSHFNGNGFEGGIPLNIVAGADAERPTRADADVAGAKSLATALDEFTASVAHEVNNPLAAIIINGQTCLRWLDHEKPQLERARKGLAAMIGNALRLSDIIWQLRALCTKTDIQRIALNLKEVIEEVVQLIEPEVRRNKVLLRLDLPSDLPSVLGDRVQLQQLMINLLINGIQAMTSVSERPRELLVRSQPQSPGEVVIVVQDNGNGIDPDHFDRLFSAFFTTKAGGTGVGLTICRSIIEAHGGRIWASRNSGYGAAFHFALPANFPGTDNEFPEARELPIRSAKICAVRAREKER
jgi:signal transduction histidine kinase